MARERIQLIGDKGSMLTSMNEELNFLYVLQHNCATALSSKTNTPIHIRCGVFSHWLVFKRCVRFEDKATRCMFGSFNNFALLCLFGQALPCQIREAISTLLLLQGKKLASISSKVL